MSSSDLLEKSEALAAHFEELISLGRTEEVEPAELQRLLTAAVRLYSTKAEREGGFPAVTRGSLTATDAMITSSALLQSANVQVFELGLWQSWAH
jgi:hypothetical protein